MRRLLLPVASAFLLAVAAGAQAQSSKVDSQWTCQKPSEAHSLEAGDQQGHAYTISKFSCTATKGVIDGEQEKTGEAVQSDEVHPGKSAWHGVFIEALASGDHIYVHYQGSGTLKGENLVSGRETWKVVGGTGKFAGATGQGSCEGKGAADGTATFNCSGTLKKAAGKKM